MRKENNRARLNLCALALIGMCVLVPYRASADGAAIEEPTVFEFQRLDGETSPAIAQFADRFIRELVRKEQPLMPAWWRKKGDKSELVDFVRYLEADLLDDGSRALFLQVDLGPYCGTAGCETYVFERTQNGLALLCSDNMYDRAITILPEKEQGIHLIDTGEAIIHWSDRAGPSGQRCYAVAKPANPQGRAGESIRVKFQRIDVRTDPQIARLAEDVIRREKILMPPWWYQGRHNITDVASYLEFDLSGKGSRELFLQIDTGCGTDGCATYIYRRTPAGYEQICEDDMDDAAISILPKKENGFYLIDTGKSFIHWMQKPNSAGRLCE